MQIRRESEWNMKRSRKMLFNSFEGEKPTKNKVSEGPPRQIILGKRNISGNIYTSPSTGHTLQVLQTATINPQPPDSPTPSTSTVHSERIQILEHKIIQPAYQSFDTPIIDDHSPISSDDNCEIFSSPKNHKEQPPTYSLVTETKPPAMTDQFNYFSTPKNRKKQMPRTSDVDLLLHKKGEKTVSSAITSRCGSLSDISTSNMVSLNSSFNEDQLFNLLATPPQKEKKTINTKTIPPHSTDKNLPIHSSSNVKNLIASNPLPMNTPQTGAAFFDSDSNEDNSASISGPTDSSSEDTSSEVDSCYNTIPSSATNDDEWQDITDSPLSFEEFEGTVEILVPSNVREPDEYYKLFITDDIINKIVVETNKYASKYLESNNVADKSRANLWKATDSDEMHKFFAILLAMGFVKLPHINDYWSRNKLYRNECITSLMSRDRFLLLLKFWHFSDNSNSTNDKLYKIREIHDMLLLQFKKVLKPGKVLVVDESMVPWRGRLLFRQHIKNKSHKYGVKLYKACTPEGYTFNIIIYTGKGDGGRELNHAQNVVMKLIQDLENEGRIVVADNFYSSIGLTEALIDKKTFYCGTLRSNRKGLPKPVVSTKLKKGDIIGKMNNKGIKVIKWFDKRPVLMMTTCKNHDTSLKNTGKKRRRTNEEILKPDCVLTYNSYKKGIDYSDQMSSYYSTLRRGLKWYRKVMLELLFGTAVINALIVYNLQNENKLTKKEFIEHVIQKFSKVSLRKQPMIPEMDSTSTLPTSTAETVHNLIMGNKKRNCSGCYDKLRQTLSSKVAGNKVKKVKTMCNACKKTLCRDCYNENHTSNITA